MDSEYVILGGGVAGLCAAIRLVELGKRPLLIEAGEYPSHKVCGEFFSQASMDFLKKWDIHPIEIHEAQFHAGSEKLRYRFPQPAGSLSHITFDPLLVDRALGTTILTKTKVAKWQPGPHTHTLVLESGKTIRSPNIIIAAGRLPQHEPIADRIPNKPIYKGLKAHFKGEIPPGMLQMFLFKDSYAGVSPIEDGNFNVACLCKIGEFEKWGSAKEYVEYLRSQNKEFNKILDRGQCLFSQWMTVPAPEFGVKKTPDYPNTYFIGDAASSIPPATGNGLTLAIKSGIMAAEFAVRKDDVGFKNAWKKCVGSPIFWGKALQHATMRPWMALQLMKLGRTYPSIIDFIFQKTR